MMIKARLKTAVRSVAVWINTALLAAFPFADSIMNWVSTYLPSFAPYLPDNIYKGVGIAVVLFNIWHASHKAHQLAEAKNG